MVSSAPIKAPSESKQLSHTTDKGEASMVDVSAKATTSRTAIAQAIVRMASETLKLIIDGDLPKGDVLAVARVAGIQAAKKTSDLIPLCHPLPITKAGIDFEVTGPGELTITSVCRVTGQTGVEMEALTGASVAALTVYDMCKAVDKGMTVHEIALLEKTGGKSGHYVREGT